MPTSVRLDAETELLLSKLARAHGQTKSDVMREALRQMAQHGQREPAESGPYALASDLIGIVQGGPKSLARGHKKAFREALAAKAER